MANEQATLLGHLSRDKLFSIYQFLLLESFALEELSRSSSKEAMVEALSQVLPLKDAQYCVDFFENYEFYDVPAMKWEMLNALPDELLGTLHTIYLDDDIIVEDHNELVDRLGQSPYFLKEDARKFYLWYHYFRKRVSLDQLDASSSAYLSMPTQRVDLQGGRDAPMFTMASHGDILGAAESAPATAVPSSPVTGGESLQGSTRITPAPKRSDSGVDLPDFSFPSLDSPFQAAPAAPVSAAPASNPAPPPSPAPSMPSPSSDVLERRHPGTQSREDRVSLRASISKASVNRTIEITALDLDSYMVDRDKEAQASTRTEETRVDHSFARVVEQIEKAKKERESSASNPVPAFAPTPPVENEAEAENQSTIILDSMELNAAFDQVDLLSELPSQEDLVTPPPNPVSPPSPVSPETEGDEEPLALSDEDMLVDSVSLEGGEVEPVGHDTSDSDVMELEPLDELEPVEELEGDAVVNDATIDRSAEDAFSLNNSEKTRPGASPLGNQPPKPPTNGAASAEKGSVNGANGVGSDSKLSPPPAGGSTPSLPGLSSMPQFGAAMMTRAKLDQLTTLLYRISLLGAPYGRIQIRAIRLYMQKILGSDPPQLRWVRDKLKALQAEDLPLVPPPLDGLAELLPNMSYGMRLHFLHTAIFLLGVKTLNTVERQHELLQDLAVELGIAPDDVSFFQLFNIGRDEINLSMQDCLSLFGLEQGATEDEIRKAHRTMARRFHPDKFHALGPEFLRMAERKMKEANMALEILLYRADRNL
ncbi:MAG: J domain-containing protein [Deltaproteobacteria bacterium]|nr:MAG: J domain-containing protein [Deltaproteobacteria bacterium]